MNDEHTQPQAENEDVYVANPDDEFYEDEYLADLPGWPKPVGILSIVFGSIAVTCMGIGLAFMGFGANMMAGQLGDDPVPPSMQLNAGLIIQGAGVVLANILLVIAGIACLARNRVTRPIHLVYAVMLLVLTGVGIVYQLQILAAMDQYAIDYPDNPISQQHDPTMARVQALIVTGIYLIWPVFCLIWFGLVKKSPDDLTGGVDTDTI